MRTELQTKILSRGYWQVVIRPSRFDVHRLADIGALLPLVETNKVSVRGWDFPHVDNRAQPHVDVDWVGQELDWEHVKSIWRIYQSGQFYFLGGVALDWRDESRLWPVDANWSHSQLLGVGDTIATLTEFFEFAARLAISTAGDDVMHIDITAGNLRGRQLYTDSSRRWPLRPSYTAALAKYPHVEDVARTKLMTEGKLLALSVAKDLFARFNANLEMDILRDWQNEMRY